MEALYWLIAAAVFILLEILTMGLTTIWFAGGALVAAVAAMLLLPISVQVIIFIVVSLILLMITRPLASHFINNKAIRTNAESLIGQSCLVTEEIDNLRATGQVTIRGQAWSARSKQADKVIPQNAIVKVEHISGVKLIVSVVSYPEKLNTEKNA
ncbi:MAG: NfeD family protein [Eubacteriales bacterium]|nr:NfeD family protein [Eubacteriales bacterium]